MTESDRRQRAVADDFAGLDDWMLRFQQLIEHGAAMPPLPEALRTDDRLVRGCQSRAWIATDVADGVLTVQADSEAQIVRGLASLLVRVFDGLPAAEAAAADLWFAREIGLAEHLSPNRANGLDAMVRTIREAAGAAAGD